MITKSTAKKKFISLLKNCGNVAITCHYSPDDDAIGSLLATYNWLVQNYPSKSFKMIVSNNYISRFSIFANYDKIQFVQDISSELRDIDMLIMLDGSQYSRFTRQPDKISDGLFTKICFDHHSSPIDKFDLAYIDKSATSASEVVMDILYKVDLISNDTAEVLLLGILGDTGTFSYLKPNQIKTFDNVKKLLQITKVEIQEFKSRYSQISQKVFTIIQEYIQNTKFIDLPNGLSYQYSFITLDSIKKNKYTDGDTSEASHVYMANYLRTIEDHRWGFIATPKRDEVSVSMRSLPGSVNVRNIVERLEIGGGHDRAAGAGFKPERWGKKLNLNFVIKYLIDWIASNELELS